MIHGCAIFLSCTALLDCVCVQLADTALQLESPFALLPWRDELQRLAWCIRFAPLTKRSEYVVTICIITILTLSFARE